jgi:hypothetical protein
MNIKNNGTYGSDTHENVASDEESENLTDVALEEIRREKIDFYKEVWKIDEKKAEELADRTVRHLRKAALEFA